MENRRPSIILPLGLLLATSVTAACRGGKSPGDMPGESLTRYAKAKNLYETGRLEEAEREFADLAKKHRAFHQAAFMEGKAAFFQGDVERAARIFSRLKRRNPGHFDAAFWYARCLGRLNRVSEEEWQYLRILAVDNRDPRVLYQLALINLETNRLPEAFDYLEKATLFGEELALMLVRLGRLYYRYGLYEQALEELEKALVLLGERHPLRQPVEELVKSIREEGEDERW